MDFLELAKLRQSCRAYDETREVEPEKLQAILEAGRLAPSACNSQPYRITVCQGGKSQGGCGGRQRHGDEFLRRPGACPAAAFRGKL